MKYLVKALKFAVGLFLVLLTIALVIVCTPFALLKVGIRASESIWNELVEWTLTWDA